MRDRDQSISPPPSTLSAPPAPPLPPPSLPPPAPPAPPPTWEDTNGFRETFLVQLEPDEAEAFRRAGDHLYNLACERGRQDAPESFLRMTLRAVLADLRHLEGLLGHVAHDLVGCDLDPNDARLLTLAARVVLELHWTADAIDGEIGPSPSAPAPSEPAV